MASKASEVFAIFELLEKILLDAQFEDVVRFQRVNTGFRDTIEKSLPLRRKLFYVQSNSTSPTQGPTVNPAFWRVIKRYLVDWGEFSLGTLGFDQQSSAGAWEYKKIGHVFTVRTTSTKVRGGAESGSWREMLIVDPPCRVDVCIGRRFELPRGEFTLSVITMGELLDWFDARKPRARRWRSYLVRWRRALFGRGRGK